ncbi:MAG: potassium transporter TrkG [Veillonellaceae bacterium]|nr:potassium transporter TrkG [Veillonellaceae bacterium]
MEKISNGKGLLTASRDSANTYHMPNPYRMLVISFAFVMFVGALLLWTPWAREAGAPPTHFVDAAFTAVSCVSVTGLATVDTYVHWSWFGKIVMTILIQLGGLGIMSFTTMAAYMLGQRIGLENRLILQEALGQNTQHGLLTLLKKVMGLTFFVEAIGALAYSFQLYPYMGIVAIPYGIMQAVSTFCNAGFVFFDNNLPYVMVTNWGFTMITTLLIIIGGFGYIPLFDLLNHWQHKQGTLTLHTKIMLCGTAILIVGGTLCILGLEWNNPGTLGPLSPLDKLQASYFQAVTPRTAGIATLDYGQMHYDTAFLSIVLMFIGAGPNSTGGGIKVSTIVLIWAAAITIFTGKKNPELFGWRLSTQQIYQAFGVAFFSTIVLIWGAFILSWVEHFTFLDDLFEVTSAFGTVGLTRGITPYLSDVSKWTLIVVMFIGRVGVLSVIGAVALRRKPNPPITYPEGQVLL